MNFELQDVAASTIVFVAVAYLMRVFYRKWIRAPKIGESSGCGSCGSCPSAGSRNASEPVVIDISSPTIRQT